MNPDWLRPDWPAPPNVHAVFTTRHGGLSAGLYGSMNLGGHVGDLPQYVAGNREILGHAIGCEPVYLNQVHGVDICHLPAQAAQTPLMADGAYTAQVGQVCSVMVADCLPVLLCDVHGTAVAAAHAGWRGLAGSGGEGVLEAAIRQFKPQAPVEYAQAAPELIAWLGPCIGPMAFDVGPEVRQAFLQSSPEAEICFLPHDTGKWMCDLARLARQRLASAGVRKIFGNDSSAPWCTVSNPSRFFSFRRDRVSGRMAACVWLT